MLNENQSAQVPATKRLTESALLVALATVLALYAVFKLPNGGSVTMGSMVPIMLISFKYSFGWSVLAALAYSFIQMMLNFYAPPVATLGYYVLMVLLDYIVAFGVLSFAGPVYRRLDQGLAPRLRLMIAAMLCIAVRFACHFLSGIIIWAAYAPEGQPLWLYSLLYNGSYMLGEGLISGFILYLAGPKLVSLFLGEKA